MLLTVVEEPQYTALTGISRSLKRKNLQVNYLKVFKRGCERIRTAVQGFADLCLTARPRNRFQFKKLLLLMLSEGNANIKLSEY